MKMIYHNPTGDNILNCEKLKAFPLGLVTRQRCPFSSLLHNIVAEDPDRAVRQEKDKASELERNK